MAYLNKDQYDYRRETAARRAADNKQITTLTDEQHDLIAEVARMRHEIHCSVDSMYNCESVDYNKWQWIDNGSEGINDRLSDAGLPKIQFTYNDISQFPTSEDRYTGVIDNTDEAEEENRNEYYKMMLHLNSNMEVYLTMIDREYGTHYAPTGELRK
jgi:hypothetical protein